MTGVAKRSLRASMLTAPLAAALWAGPLWAQVSISIQYDSSEQLELARRILSELESEGYEARIEPGTQTSPCEANQPGALPVARGTRAWIRLAAGSEDDAVEATICYLGALPFLQQATTSAPRSEPRRLALATAEALNGLRAKLPPIESEVPRTDRPHGVPRSIDRRAAVGSSEQLTNSVVLGTALVLSLPDFPPAPNVHARATLGMLPSAGLILDALVPTTGTELTSDEVAATVRTAWLRIGPRFGGPAGDFDFSGAALAGPRVTWATAVARAPRLGTADVATGAVFSLAGLVEYPNKSSVFASASASASLLVPGARVKLGDAAPSRRGSWPLEVTIGIGARWGQGR